MHGLANWHEKSDRDTAYLESAQLSSVVKRRLPFDHTQCTGHTVAFQSIQMSQVTHPKNFWKFLEVTCHRGSVRIGPGHGHRGPNLNFFSHINTVSLWLHLCFFWFLMSTMFENFQKSQVTDDLSKRSSSDRDVTGYTLFKLIEMVQYHTGVKN